MKNNDSSNSDSFIQKYFCSVVCSSVFCSSKYQNFRENDSIGANFEIIDLTEKKIAF